MKMMMDTKKKKRAKRESIVRLGRTQTKKSSTVQRTHSKARAPCLATGEPEKGQFHFRTRADWLSAIASRLFATLLLFVLPVRFDDLSFVVVVGAVQC